MPLSHGRGGCARPRVRRAVANSLTVQVSRVVVAVITDCDEVPSLLQGRNDWVHSLILTPLVQVSHIRVYINVVGVVASTLPVTERPVARVFAVPLGLEPPHDGAGCGAAWQTVRRCFDLAPAWEIQHRPRLSVQCFSSPMYTVLAHWPDGCIMDQTAR